MLQLEDPRKPNGVFLEKQVKFHLVYYNLLFFGDGNRYGMFSLLATKSSFSGDSTFCPSWALRSLCSIFRSRITYSGFI